MNDRATIIAALRIAASMIGHDRTPYIELLLKLTIDETNGDTTDLRQRVRDDL